MSKTFFTELAPDARIQGSRDPLGILPVWSRLGRGLIRNVTTVSGDLRGWTTLLIMAGLYGELVETGAIDAQDTAALYRAEQLVAFSRISCNPNAAEVRGSTRLKALLARADGGKRPIRLGLDPERRILNNQGATGVWGQISSPAGASRLIDKGRHCLTADSLPVWHQSFRPRLAEHLTRINEILLDNRGFEPGKGDRDLARRLESLHEGKLTQTEADVYRDHVLYAGAGSASVQANFVDLWRKQSGPTALRKDLDMVKVAALAIAARRANQSEVAVALENIVSAEKLLSPMEQLFSWILGRHRETMDQLVVGIRAVWPNPIHQAAAATDDMLRGPIESVYGRGEVFDAFIATRAALVSGAWATAVTSLIQLNALTMRRRGGDSWVTVNKDRLDVRIADEQAALPEPDELDRALVHSFYLDPLRRLIVSWEDGQNG